MAANKILIVDDNKRNIQVLATSLSIAQYEIEYASSGKEALCWLENEDFDLIMLDVMMPEMDGFTVCSKIKAMPLKAAIPIIFITANNDVESVTKGFNLGGVDYITKPFNESELLARVKTHIDLKRYKDNLEELVELRTNQLREAYKELEVLDIAKGEFLSMLSHEIRTPLNGILGILYLMKSNAEPEDISGYINLLDLSAKRLEEFSFKALLVTQLRSKRYPIIKKKIQLEDIINETIKAYEAEFNKKSISIEFTSSKPVNSVFFDKNLIYRVIDEVVKNILRHSHNTSKVDLTIYNKNGNTVMEIVDNGDGFPENVLKSIFKPFGFGGKIVDRNVGLGLHLVKLIMDSHNCKVIAGNKTTGGAFVRLII